MEGARPPQGGELGGTGARPRIAMRGAVRSMHVQCTEAPPPAPSPSDVYRPGLAVHVEYAFPRIGRALPQPRSPMNWID